MYLPLQIKYRCCFMNNEYPALKAVICLAGKAVLLPKYFSTINSSSSFLTWELCAFFKTFLMLPSERVRPKSPHSVFLKKHSFSFRWFFGQITRHSSFCKNYLKHIVPEKYLVFSILNVQMFFIILAMVLILSSER